jgi:ankyrin repeat protein
MKKIIFFLLITNFSFASFDLNYNLSIEELMLKSIKSNNFDDVQKLLSSRKISARKVINGKPLLVHAVINDNPNIVNLLVRYGAQPFIDVCSDGLNAFEWSVKSNSYYARAELIVIKILHN